MMDLSKLTTETRNEKTMNLDELSTSKVLELMNAEDQTVPVSIKKALPEVALAVKKIVDSFQAGGRLFYIGAGTSGRLGVLDAAECVPTFGTDPEMVQGLIAGGEQAMTVAVEGAEDSVELGENDLKAHHLSDKDTVVGIAASGRTPYVIGGLDYAKKIGASRISLACNNHAEISNHAEIAIEVPVGPEVLTGSTRLKSGTAQKMVLNMLSTVSMVGIGKVYKNLMVDVKPTNAKLVERSKRIIMQATECDYEAAGDAFVAADKNVKLAIVMILTNLDKNEAEIRLKNANGFVRGTIRGTIKGGKD
ncbi:N-acetylmuramic acid 6-phosphate etherase [Pediococcus damnosus]|nr:N-acetylmuramic acid 6-phosphate etherase [Pediococcus damnosus]PIO81208.1 N-acetylmuramic acid 6-phosphate etherase [Pediococcus damnosus]PIO85250.1 N-acetylmuramic acid 6-phosphate etherase [Pediococcus damnosus]PJE49271.1 N-acetylmuramic acid 6-phosphate etherase [Pediococcus damnosus]GEA92192.1 N-acetylmuramic acid 6-phosphate etherase 2 [Pediococcus damnosus]